MAADDVRAVISRACLRQRRGLNRAPRRLPGVAHAPCLSRGEDSAATREAARRDRRPTTRSRALADQTLFVPFTFREPTPNSLRGQSPQQPLFASTTLEGQSCAR